MSFSFSWCSTGGPGAQLSDGSWLSLLHLTSNFSGPQTPSGFPRAPSAGCGFPYHILSISQSDLSQELSWLLSWLSYIIVQRPLSRLLDLWNRMLDRHQAEITVMQFTGHSLPVHQSMSVPWEFFTSSHFVSQFPPTRFLLITAIRMCYFLPVHHLEWHFWPGRMTKYNSYSGTIYHTPPDIYIYIYIWIYTYIYIYIYILSYNFLGNWLLEMVIKLWYYFRSCILVILPKICIRANGPYQTAFDFFKSFASVKHFLCLKCCHYFRDSTPSYIKLFCGFCFTGARHMSTNNLTSFKVL